MHFFSVTETNRSCKCGLAKWSSRITAGPFGVAVANVGVPRGVQGLLEYPWQVLIIVFIIISTFHDILRDKQDYKVVQAGLVRRGQRSTFCGGSVIGCKYLFNIIFF